MMYLDYEQKDQKRIQKSRKPNKQQSQYKKQCEVNTASNGRIIMLQLPKIDPNRRTICQSDLPYSSVGGIIWFQCTLILITNNNINYQMFKQLIASLFISSLYAASQDADSSRNSDPKPTTYTRGSDSKNRSGHRHSVGEIGECPHSYYWNGANCGLWTSGSLECAAGYTWEKQINTCVHIEKNDLDGRATGQGTNYPSESGFGVVQHNCKDGYYWNGALCSAWCNPIVCHEEYVWYNPSRTCIHRRDPRHNHHRADGDNNQDDFNPNLPPVYRNTQVQAVNPVSHPIYIPVIPKTNDDTKKQHLNYRQNDLELDGSQVEDEDDDSDTTTGGIQTQNIAPNYPIIPPVVKRDPPKKCATNQYWNGKSCQYFNAQNVQPPSCSTGFSWDYSNGFCRPQSQFPDTTPSYPSDPQPLKKSLRNGKDNDHHHKN